jgi:hypothetical protein
MFRAARVDGAGTRSRFQKTGALTFRLRFEKDFRVVQIVPSKSGVEPLIQVADLLAGMAAFSTISHVTGT